MFKILLCCSSESPFLTSLNINIDWKSSNIYFDGSFLKKWYNKYKYHKKKFVKLYGDLEWLFNNIEETYAYCDKIKKDKKKPCLGI